MHVTRTGLGLAFAVVLGNVCACARSASSTQQGASLTDAEADVRGFLSAVANDSTMGRMTGSHGDDMAARYVAQEFHQFGLEPAGDSGTYFQAVPLRTRAYDWQRTVVRVGSDTLRIGTDYVPSPQFGDLARGRFRPIHNVRAVFGGTLGGSGRLIDSAGAAGRLVVLGVPPGGSRQAMLILFEGMPRALRGAAALAVVSLDAKSQNLVRLGQEPRLLLPDQALDTTGVPTILFVTSGAARRLLGMAPDRVTVGTKGAQIDGTIVVVNGEPEVMPRNVIAVLRGSDSQLKGTYVSLSAHHDHVGFNHTPADHDSLHTYMNVYEHFRQGSPVLQVTPQQMASIHVNVDSLRRLRPARPDSIYNGADDDGSGIAALLEIARRLSSSSSRPKRSILFLAHTGEEEGLLGSSWYSEHATVPRDSIIAEMDMDMVGRGAASDLVGGGPTYLELIGSRRQSTQFGDMIDSVNHSLARPFQINYAYDAHTHPEGDWCRADHFSYARFGIPVGAFSTSYHGDYHQVTDEIQYIDYPHLASIALFVGDLAVTAANRDQRFVLDHPKPADPHGRCVQ